MDIKNHGINNVPQIQNKNVQKVVESTEGLSSLNEVNLNNDPAYFAGRSQVKSSNKVNLNPANFDPKVVASVEKSIDALLENPKFVKQSEVMFEGNLENNKLGYEKALAVENAFIEDFS